MIYIASRPKNSKDTYDRFSAWMLEQRAVQRKMRVAAFSWGLNPMGIFATRSVRWSPYRAKGTWFAASIIEP
jgi:hypothetical protein